MGSPELGYVSLDEMLDIEMENDVCVRRDRDWTPDRDLTGSSWLSHRIQGGTVRRPPFRLNAH
jgi:hypothetical protein